MKLTSVPSFRCSTPESRSNKKSNIFTWIPASSAGMTILLFAAQLNAAGVCIICPPGYECPAGGAPVLGGAPNSILIRSGAGGTRWVSIAQLLRGIYNDLDDFGRPVGFTGQLHHCTLHRLAGNAPVQWSCTNSSTASPGNNQSLTTGSNCWCRFGSTTEGGDIRTGNLRCPASLWNWDHGNFYPQGHEHSCENLCPGICQGDAVWRSRVA